MCPRLIVVGFIKTFKVYGRFSVFLTFLLAIKNSCTRRQQKKDRGWEGQRGGAVCTASPCVPRMYLAYFVICINTGNGNDSHDTEMARHLISMQPAADSIAVPSFAVSLCLLLSLSLSLSHSLRLSLTLCAFVTNKQQFFWA